MKSIPVCRVPTITRPTACWMAYLIGAGLFCCNLPATATSMPFTKASAQNSHSAPAGVASPLEPRIVEYTYSPDQVFRLYARVGQVSHIALQAGEGLRLKPQLGDTLQWRISGGPQHWFIKPLQEGIETSMTLVSNLAVYQVQLISVRRGQPWFQKISFEHPEWGEQVQLLSDAPAKAVPLANDAQTALPASAHSALAASDARARSPQTESPILEVEDIDADCSIIGDAPFRPRAVLSSHLFTYVKLGNGPVPAIFSVEDGAKPTLVNHSFKGRWVVIEKPRASLLLKLGEQEVAIHWQRSTP